MRRLGMPCAVLLALVAGTLAEEPAKPDTPAQAAEKALAAVAAKDETELRVLAAKDAPDPWIVADELLFRGQPDAAEAFARAAPRKDTEKLPDYVASRRGRDENTGARRALALARDAMAARNAADALAAIDAAPFDGWDVPAILLRAARGLALRALGRLEESRAALLESADAALEIGWLLRASGSLHQSAQSARARGDHRAALGAWQRELELDERRGDRRLVAACLGNIGVVLDSLGEYADSLAFQQRCLALSEEVGDREGVARALGNLGVAQKKLGAYDDALATYQRAFGMREEAGDRRGMGMNLANIGIVHSERGDLGLARSFLDRALTLQTEAGDRQHAAMTLASIGLLHARTGDFARAADCTERALVLHEKLGDRSATARAHDNLGTLRHSLGDIAGAISEHERARALAAEIHEKEILANAVGNLAAVYRELGDHERGRSLAGESLELYAALGDLRRVAEVHVILGRVESAAGNAEEAMEHFERSLAIAEQSGERPTIAVALSAVSGGLAEEGRYREALVPERRAHARFEEIGDRSRAAESLNELASLHGELGELDEASALRRQALDLAERIGAKRTVARALWGTSKDHFARGEDREAITAARRAVAAMRPFAGGLSAEQSGGLMEGFRFVFAIGARAALRSGDPESAAYFLESARAQALLSELRARETLWGSVVPEDVRTREAEARIAETAAVARLRAALESGDLAAGAQRSRELAAVRDRLQGIGDAFRRESGAASGLVDPEPDSLATLRSRLRPGESLVLTCLIWEEALALVASPDRARVVSLGPVGEIAKACAALRPDAPDTEVAAAAAALRRLVVEPLGLGPTTTRVLVSPDGALSYVPFALLAPELDVAYLPSGTTYGLLSVAPGVVGDGVLALGDPAYPTELPRDVVAMRSGVSLVRLPASADEAKAVGTTVLLGADATEAGLREALAKKPRWRAVHFACHGLVDPERPMFSSLALTPAGEDDGFLTALEVFRMKVSADLAVLSACETGKGKVYRAEGIVGLTRAFMFAGAPRVLVSLWDVDDEATRALMTKFYERWNAGAPAATALRDAQAHVRAQEKWKHPRFWAAWALWGLPD